MIWNGNRLMGTWEHGLVDWNHSNSKRIATNWWPRQKSGQVGLLSG